MPWPAPDIGTTAAAPPPRSGLRALGQDLWSPAYRRAAVWSIPVALLAYGFALSTFTLAGDDWFAVFPEATLDRDYLLWAGRWVTPLLAPLMGNGAVAPAFTLAVALGLLVLAGLVAASAWRFSRSWTVFAVIALVMSSPLLTDKLNFKLSHITSQLGVVAAVFAAWLLLRWRGALGWRIGAGAALLTWAMATYQPTALFFVVVVLGGEVLRGMAEGSGYWRRNWSRWLEFAAAVVLAVGAYALSVRVAWWVTGTDPAQAPEAYSLVGGYVSSPGEAADGLARGIRTAARFWSSSTELYPLALKAAGLALAAAGTVLAATRAMRGGAGRRAARWGAGAWLGLLGAASLLLPFTAVMLREEPPVRASMFLTVGLATGFWAGLLLERLEDGPRSRRGWARGAAAVVVLLLAAGGAFQVSKGSVGLYLSNQRDLANANRMLSVMEQMPEFSQGAEIRVHLVGRVGFAVAGLPFSSEMADSPAWSIVNCSGLSCQNRLVSMLNLIGGGERPFVGRRAPVPAAYREAVEEMPPWPEPGSIRVLGGVFVVKGEE